MRPEPATSEVEPGALPAAPAWLDRAPEGPWCPPELREALPWAAAADYADLRTALHPWRAGWTLVGASRRGRLHAHRGEFREDAFGIETGEQFFLLVAADGAGSCRLSRIGSECACRAVVRRLGAVLADVVPPAVDSPALHQWLAALLAPALSAAIQDVAELARASGIDPREFRTTLLTAVWFASPAGELLAVSQVGDGFIAARRSDGRVERLGAGDVSEFSGEVSCFVPDDGASTRAQAIAVTDGADVTAILLGTDGVEDPFYPIERHGALLYSQLVGGVSEPAQHFQRQESQGPVFAPDGDQQLARWLGFERRGENDDRTLVAAWR